MKTRLIGILVVLVLIVATIIFFKMYSESKYGTSTIMIKSNGSNTSSDETKEVDNDLISSEIAEFDESDFAFNTETVIKLSDDNATVEGSNVKIDGNTIYIVSEGAYRVTGTLSNGRIIVNAPKQNVKIILDNADITCDYSSPIYVYKSKTTLLYLNDGTTNKITDGSTYTYADEFSSSKDEESNATLYSKSDLVIAGTGSLSIKANNNNGIASKDSLYIKDVTMTIDSKKHGINGKDNLTIDNSKINITSGGDALRSTNDTDTTMGWIRINNSAITIKSNGNAVQAEKDLVIDGGTISIESNSKGFKASRYLIIGGDVVLEIDSKDDSIHSNASLEINSGIITLKSEDDAIHSDDTITINNGNILVSESHEGLESKNIVINDGNIDINATDDGINVNGGNNTFKEFGGDVKVDDKNNFPSENAPDRKSRKDFSGDKFPQSLGGGNRPDGFENGERPEMLDSFENGERAEMPGNVQNPFGASSESSTNRLVINGGTIRVNSTGDGLDSNGSIEMNGGYVIVQGPTSNYNSAIDYDGSFTLNGGTIIALSSSGMAQGVKTESQGSIMATLQDMADAKSKVEIKDEAGNILIETTSERTFNCIVASSADMAVDSTYSIYINDNLATTAVASTSTAGFGFGGMMGGMKGR